MIPPLVAVALIAALAGMAIRGRLSDCWSFSAYLAACLVGNMLTSAWPDVWHTPEGWLVRNAAYDALKMGVALELAYRSFGSWPRISRRAMGAQLGVLVLVGLWLCLDPARSYAAAVVDWQPRVALGVAWILSSVLLLSVHFGLPLHPWHRAILAGLVPWTVVYGVLLASASRAGWWVPALQGAAPVANLACMAWFAWAAWGPVIPQPRTMEARLA